MIIIEMWFCMYKQLYAPTHFSSCSEYIQQNLEHWYFGDMEVALSSAIVMSAEVNGNYT
jgi:hypothetical protein